MSPRTAERGIVPRSGRSSTSGGLRSHRRRESRWARSIDSRETERASSSGPAWPWPPLIGLAFAVTARRRGGRRRACGSQGRAVRYVDQDDSLLGLQSQIWSPPSRAGGSRCARGRSSILTPTTSARVRIWSTDGKLLFSTDQSDRPGSDAGLNDPVLHETVPPRRRSHDRTSRTAGGRTIPSEACCGPMCPRDRRPWPRSTRPTRARSGRSGPHGSYYQILAGGVLLLFLVMTRAVAPRSDRADQHGRPLRRLLRPRRVLADRRRSTATRCRRSIGSRRSGSRG